MSGGDIRDLFALLAQASDDDELCRVMTNPETDPSGLERSQVNMRANCRSWTQCPARMLLGAQAGKPHSGAPCRRDTDRAETTDKLKGTE
jgi:hypothetical protein